MIDFAAIPTFPRILQDFFCLYLIDQRNVSRQTVASYRDTFRIMLHFIRQDCMKEPSDLALSDINAELVLKFLHYLEEKRANTIQSRNVRLAAVRSFMKYAALRDPRALANAEALQAIPLKRTETHSVGYLSRSEIDAILLAPDPSTWSGRRDRTMFVTFYNTGARVSEIRSLKVADVDLKRSKSINLHGKGRKERTLPLWKKTQTQIRQWLAWTDSHPNAPLFPNRKGEQMTRSGIEDRLQRAVTAAAVSCPSLVARKVSPHTLRHTTAMHLLDAGVSVTVIALWLGHVSINTTHRYVEADLERKKRALSRLQEPRTGPVCFRPKDRLLSFLESL